MTRLLCYELNEVPWRVIDRYVAGRPGSNVARLLKRSAQITTRTTDSGELHPWSTWPTMHRGVNNDAHHIRFINQDLSVAKQTPPVWQIMVANGKSVGLVGCLQSYPPSRDSDVLFHVPDTFAPGPETHPTKYVPFQSINLKLTGDNKAVARKIGLHDMVTGLQLLNCGVSLSTASRIASHLVAEQLNSLQKTRRPTMQAHLAFDIFMDALRADRPHYAAFFSNHVAGMMHRYWKYSFPEDFNYELRPTKADRFHAQSIDKGMDIFDEQLGRLVAFCERHGYDLVVASSMGQEAIERSPYIPELMLDSVAPLAAAMGFVQPVKMNLAMQPDVALQFSAADDLQEFSSLLAEMRDANGEEVLKVRYKPQGLTLNVSVGRSTAVLRDCSLYFRGHRLPLDRIGMRVITRDPGTGYHQPDGILIWSGATKPVVAHREVVDSRRYAPTLLDALGIVPPAYMMPPLPRESSRQVADAQLPVTAEIQAV